MRYKDGLDKYIDERDKRSPGFKKRVEKAYRRLRKKHLKTLLKRAKKLTRGVKINLNKPLDPKDD